MNQTELLDKYYNAFIQSESPKEFFLGLRDYLEFADFVPEFDRITTEISNSRKPLEEKLNVLRIKALERLAAVHKEISVYVKKNKIDNHWINQSLLEYESWLKGKTWGSQSLPDALHGKLRDVIEALYGMPDHKGFSGKYIKFFEDRTDLIKHYFYSKEIFDFFEFEQEIKRQKEEELWGQLDEISWLYETVKRGRARYKGLVEESNKTHSSKGMWDVMNYGLLIGEWDQIEQGTGRKPVFFNVQKIRPLVRRLHLHILSRSLITQSASSENIKNLTSVENKEIPRNFQPQLIIEKKIGYFKFYKEGKKIKIGTPKTRPYRLLDCLLDPLGAAKTVDVVFEAVRLSKDEKDGNLKDPHTANARKVEIMQYAIKELQKITELKGKISLTSLQGNRSVKLNLNP